MEINEALDHCLASMMGPSERLLALAASLAQDARPGAPPALSRPVPFGMEDEAPLPAKVAQRNRFVLRNSHAMLSQALDELRAMKKA